MSIQKEEPGKGTAVYFRCSPMNGDDPVRQSFNAQLGELKPLAEKHGIENASIYVDSGGTGMHFYREGFQLLLSHVCSGFIGCILMTERTRMSSDVASAIQMEEALKEMGVEIVYARSACENEATADLGQAMGAYAHYLLGTVPDEDTP